ncbi:M23 family metallopeptidase [Metallibacterium sp.]
MRTIRRAVAGLLLFTLAVSAQAFACQPVSTILGQGEMLDGVFAHWGVTRSDAFVWGQKIAQRMPLSTLRAGDHIEACLVPVHGGHHLVGVRIVHKDRHFRGLVLGWGVGGAPARNIARNGPVGEGGQLLAAVLTSTADKAPVSAQTPILPRGTPEDISFMVAHSLTAELEARHFDPVMASAVKQWLHVDSNLPQPLPPGTLVDALFIREPGVREPDLVRLTVYDAGREHTLYRFRDAHGDTVLADSDGQGLMPIALVMPVPSARLTSGWGWRINPVLHIPEFHKGVDLAAPMGTPIHAVASGRVDFFGWHGYYGQMVELRNGPDLVTRYGHMSRYARGLHDGEMVHAGQVIGYVGSTGLSTGPHLYFEIWEHGKRIDPLRIEAQTAAVTPQANPVKLLPAVVTPVQLDGSELSRFQAFRVALQRALNAPGNTSATPIATATINPMP